MHFLAVDSIIPSMTIDRVFVECSHGMYKDGRSPEEKEESRWSKASGEAFVRDGPAELLDRPQSAVEPTPSIGARHGLGQQITAVLTTVEALERGEQPIPEKMFDGFDHTRHEQGGGGAPA